jgi:transposase-like protein
VRKLKQQQDENTRLKGLVADLSLDKIRHGITVREIQSHLQEFYGIEVSPSLISTIAEAVIVEVQDGARAALMA